MVKNVQRTYVIHGPLWKLNFENLTENKVCTGTRVSGSKTWNRQNRGTGSTKSVLTVLKKGIFHENIKDIGNIF